MLELCEDVLERSDLTVFEQFAGDLVVILAFIGHSHGRTDRGNRGQRDSRQPFEANAHGLRPSQNRAVSSLASILRVATAVVP